MRGSLAMSATTFDSPMLNRIDKNVRENSLAATLRRATGKRKVNLREWQCDSRHDQKRRDALMPEPREEKVRLVFGT